MAHNASWPARRSSSDGGELGWVHVAVHTPRELALIAALTRNRGELNAAALERILRRLASLRT